MITLAAIFTFFANVLFAGNDYLNTTPAPASNIISTEYFIPAIPAEATFEDATLTPDFTGLYPVVLAEASFEEVISNEISNSSLAPVIPSEADFE